MAYCSKLEELRVKNFKSFAGKHRIGPFLNFTAVIGPNGGGKSNIMDAVSFVLGVRSADLRASNLKELIYRKESEKLSELSRDAYVKILFKTDKGSYMHFKRTIAANGISEYSINKTKENAETYLDVLASFNIFTRAKNFLIFQGQVDALAMKSGRELTLLFEKISGSEDMKTDYDTSKNQVEICEENLKSMNSKITFLKAEKKKLKEQKAHAVSYEKGVERLRELQEKFYLLQLCGIQGELERKHKKITDKVEELDEARLNKEKCRVSLRDCEISLKNGEQRLANVIDDIANKNSLLLNKKPETVKLTEAVRQIEERVRVKEEELHLKKTQLARDSKRREDLLSEKSIFESEIQAQLELLDQQLETSIHESKKREYLQLKKEFGILTFAEQKELETMKNDLSTKEIQFNILSQSLKEKQFEKKKIDQEYEDLHRVISRKVSDRDKLEEFKTAKLSELKSTTLELQNLKSAEEDLTAKIHSLDLKIRDFRATETHNSIQDKEKSLIDELVRQNKGVRGTLADLISPIQPRYSTAMQVGLGAMLSYIVVDTMEIGHFVIQKLKDASCTKEIIILENIPDTHKSETLRQAVSQYGSLLIDVLTYNKDFGLEKAMNMFTGSKAVAESLDSANKLRKIKGVKQVITLDGVCIRSAVISSAPQKRRFEKVSQKKALAEKEVEELRAELGKIHQMTRGDNSVHVIRKKIDECTNALASLNNEINGLNKQMEVKKQQKKDISDLVFSIERNYSAISESINKLKQEVTSKYEGLKRLENKHFGKFCEDVGVDSIQMLEGRNLEQENRIQEKIILLKKEAATTSWALKSINLKSIQAGIDQIEGSIVSDFEELGKLKAKQQSYSKDYQNLTETSKNLRELEITLKEQVSKLKEEYETLNKNFETCSKSCNKLEKEFANEDREYQHMKYQKEQKIEELLVKNVEIPYIVKQGHKEIDFGRLDRRVFSMSISEIDKETEEISRGIEKESKNLETLASSAKCTFQAEKMKEIQKRLDEANKALENYDRMNKDSKAHFLQVKEKRRSQFMQIFDVVAQNIGKIYKDMTKSEKNTYYGGNAQLYLDNHEEPYNGGVIYSPTPPGKRCMYEMDQLSGGEKTIAALSLLFSIHSAMPSPFYIMDEVDAFLDYDNCQLLLNYLLHMSENKSQCIIITHKEEFFCNADNIIGTTFISSENTSKSFSLDLNQFGAKQLIVV